MSRQNDKEQARQWAREMLSQPPGQVAILDTETCDLHGEVIELALIDTAGNELYNRRFSPLTEIQPGAQAVHGITREMLRGEPLFAAEYEQIAGLIGRAEHMLIYNADFDVSCLAYTCDGNDKAILHFVGHCLMRWYAQWYGERGRSGYRWQKLTGGDHSALGDARAALQLLRRMAEADGGS